MRMGAAGYHLTVQRPCRPSDSAAELRHPLLCALPMQQRRQTHIKSPNAAELYIDRLFRCHGATLVRKVASSARGPPSMSARPGVGRKGIGRGREFDGV